MSVRRGFLPKALRPAQQPVRSESMVQILPSRVTHPTSQTETVGAEKEATTGTMVEHMSPFRSAFPCRCVQRAQSEAEPHQSAPPLPSTQSEPRHFPITSHQSPFQEGTDIMLNGSYSKLHRFAFEKKRKKNCTQINTEEGRYFRFTRTSTALTVLPVLTLRVFY